ncbi:MAG TPA: ABC transporter substrate-binding protein [Burkholderiales bacterium]|nr:ABC transporter substrate-binding protein [Burkholderiales bacterium]
MKRRQFVTLIGSAAVAWPIVARAEQPAKVTRIGFLGAVSAEDLRIHLDALREGLRDLGHVEGKNLIIEYRWAEGKYDRLPKLAAELVRLDVSIIVTHGTPGSLAAKRATATVPIVMAISGDAVATGLIQSIARPGGNVTGSTFFFPELNAKRVDLLKEAIPPIRLIGVLVNPNNASHVPALRAMEATARSLQLEIHPFPAKEPGQFAGAFSAMVERRVEAVAVVDDRMLIAGGRTIAKLAMTRRLPIIGGRELIEGDGLMAYGVDFVPMYRRAATFVDKILKGAKPADLPVEQAAKFELVVNLRAARALGINMPLSILLRADQVIE